MATRTTATSLTERSKTIFVIKGLLQNAVFRPGKEIFALTKLARTAGLTVLANFFFDLIF